MPEGEAMSKASDAYANMDRATKDTLHDLKVEAESRGWLTPEECANSIINGGRWKIGDAHNLAHAYLATVQSYFLSRDDRRRAFYSVIVPFLDPYGSAGETATEIMDALEGCGLFPADRRKVDDRRGTATADEERAWCRAGMEKKRVGEIDRRIRERAYETDIRERVSTEGSSP